MGLSIVRSIVNLLGGSIGIRSEVGKGTEVTIRLPLMRVSGTDSVASTPSGASSIEGLQGDAVTTLQAEYPGRTIALYGGANGTKISEVLYQYITKWFGLDVVTPDETTPFSADIVLVDEKEFPSLLETKFFVASIIVLCSNSIRYSRKESHMNSAIVVEFVLKPYGPYKLAKALRLCLDKAKEIKYGRKPVPVGSPVISDAGTIVPGLEALTLKPEDLYAQTTLQMNGAAVASESVNARMTVDTLSTMPETGKAANAGEEFPFPVKGNETQEIDVHNTAGLDRDDMKRWTTSRPKLTHRVTEPSRPVSTFSFSVPPFPLLVTTEEMETTEALDPGHAGSFTSRAAVRPLEKRPPRLLLVDDNCINLRLLQTYMRKRKYQLVDSAVNGQLAVEAAESHPEGYDIIFMGELLLFHDFLSDSIALILTHLSE